jgi:hypothetical protein
MLKFCQTQKKQNKNAYALRNSNFYPQRIKEYTYEQLFKNLQNESFNGPHYCKMKRLFINKKYLKMSLLKEEKEKEEDHILYLVMMEQTQNTSNLWFKSVLRVNGTNIFKIRTFVINNTLDENSEYIKKLQEKKCFSQYSNNVLVDLSTCTADKDFWIELKNIIVG